MIEYHDPQAEVNVKNYPYDLGVKIMGSNQITLGLMANGFPDSENFLALIAEVLQAREPGIKVQMYNKGNASVPASDELLAEITDQCEAVVAAYGH